MSKNDKDTEPNGHIILQNDKDTKPNSYIILKNDKDIAPCHTPYGLNRNVTKTITHICFFYHRGLIVQVYEYVTIKENWKYMYTHLV